MEFHNRGRAKETMAGREVRPRGERHAEGEEKEEELPKGKAQW